MLKATAATSDRIRGVALKILEQDGPDAVSMRRIARALQITPMAIYHHFRNREALMQSIVDREFAKFLEAMAHIPRGASHAARLRHSLDAYIQYSFDRPRIFDYVFSEPRPSARRYPKNFRERASPTLNQLADAVSEAMEAGYLRRADTWEVALELWAHAHGYIALYRAGRFELSRSEFVALVHRSLKRLLHGLQRR